MLIVFEETTVKLYTKHVLVWESRNLWILYKAFLSEHVSLTGSDVLNFTVSIYLVVLGETTEKLNQKCVLGNSITNKCVFF